MTDERRRLAEALGAPDPAVSLRELAQALRTEGMSQVAIYHLFAEQHRRLPGDDPLHAAVADTLDLVWGGPWAKGAALFDEELTADRLARE